MALSKSPHPSLHPDVQKWKDQTEAIKRSLDKRKGEEGLVGLQQARESFCQGVKIMSTLLNDASFPEESVRELEQWCREDFAEHQCLIDRSSFAEFIFLLLRAITAVGLEPQFYKSSKSTPSPIKIDQRVQSDKDTPPDPLVVARILRTVSYIMSPILEGHEVAGDEPNKSPYVSREWFDLILTLLEYAEGQGLNHSTETEHIIDVFETLASYTNTKKCGVWGSDQASFRARLRLGTLILESKVTVLSIHGLRVFIYSLPTSKPKTTKTAKSKIDEEEESLEDLRWNYLLAAMSKHPLWAATTSQMRRAMRAILDKLPIKVALKPRDYMHMVNLIYNINAFDRPQGFPVASCVVDGENMASNDKAKERLSQGEVIVYVDQFGMRINDFNEFGREEPYNLTHIHERLYNIHRLSDPNMNRFEFYLLSLHARSGDLHVVIDIETVYADKFEATLKRLLPDSAWLDHVQQLDPKQTSAPDNDTGDLVPPSSPLEGSIPDEDESRVLDSAVDIDPSSLQASHASDSFGLSLAQKGTGGRSSLGSKAKAKTPSALVQEVKTAEEEKEDDEEEEEEGPADAGAEDVPEVVIVEQPRRSTRSSNSTDSKDSNKSKSAAKPAGKTPAKSAKAPSKIPAKTRAKATPPSVGDRPADVPPAAFEPTEESSELLFIPFNPSSSVSTSGRPSRAAKTRSMQKTTGVISGEAVPLVVEVGKPGRKGKKIVESSEAGVGGLAEIDNPVVEEMGRVADEDEADEVVPVVKKAAAKTGAKGKAAVREKETEEPMGDVADVEEVIVVLPGPKKAAAKTKAKGKVAVEEEADEPSAPEVAVEVSKTATTKGKGKKTAADSGEEKASGVEEMPSKPAVKTTPEVELAVSKKATTRGKTKGKGVDGSEEKSSGAEEMSSKPTPKTRGKAKGKVAEVSEKEPEAMEVVVEEPKKTKVGKGKGKAAPVDADEEAGGSEDGPKNATSDPFITSIPNPVKIKTPTILVPASSQQVPITKPNALSRSRQKYSREKPVCTTKVDEDSESETDDANVEVDDVDPLDSITAQPDPLPPTSAPKRGSKATKAAPTSPDPFTKAAPTTTRAKATSKPAAPAVVAKPAKVNLRSTKPKETIAGEIKSGRAMTPAAAKAKAKVVAVVAGEAEKMESAVGVDKDKGKGRGKGKKAGPPKAVVEDKASTAPGRMEGVHADEDDEPAVEADGGGEVDMGMEEKEEVVKGTKGKKAAAPKRAGPARGKQAVSPVEIEVEEEEAAEDQMDVGDKGKKGKNAPPLDVELPAPVVVVTPVPVDTKSKSKTKSKPAVKIQPTRTTTPAPDLAADTDAVPDLATTNDGSGIVESITEDVASPFKSAQRRSTPAKKTTSRSTRAQAARVSPATDHEADPASRGVRPSTAAKEAPAAPEPQAGAVAEQVQPAPPIEFVREQSAQAKTAPAGDLTKNSARKRSVESDEVEEPPRKRSPAVKQRQSPRHPAGAIHSAVEPDIPQLLAVPVVIEPSKSSVTSRQLEVNRVISKENDGEEVLMVQTSPHATTVPRKRKVSISQPEVQERKVRKVDNKGGRRMDADTEAHKAARSVMATIDSISEAVKRRVEDRLAIPNKVILAIERHVSQVACKSVKGFTADHDATYQALSAQSSDVHIKQSNLQDQYNTHAVTAKAQHRELCDFFKMYKRPMEGIPVSLFD